MAKLSRIRGFAFNDVEVDNLKFDLLNNIYLISVTRSATPIKTRYDFIVPKRHGSQTFDNRYEDKYIDIVVGIYDTEIERRRTRQRTFLQSFVGIKSRLVFLDEPTLFYEAEVIDSIETNEGEIFTEITIHFKASYCKYEFLDDLSDIIVDNMTMTVDEMEMLVNSLEWTNINTLTYKTITNNGNYKATPIVEIHANSNCTSITINNGINSFTLKNLVAGETVFVDTEKMIVYKKVNGAKRSVMTRFTGQFLTIPVGDTTITINGQSFDINLSIEFRNTYIV